MAVFSLALGWLIAGRFVRPLHSIITAPGTSPPATGDLSDQSGMMDL
jgi:hypothetical protein